MAGLGNYVLQDGRRGLLREEITTYLEGLGLPVALATGNNGRLTVHGAPPLCGSVSHRLGSRLGSADLDRQYSGAHWHWSSLAVRCPRLADSDQARCQCGSGSPLRAMGLARRDQ